MGMKLSYLTPLLAAGAAAVAIAAVPTAIAASAGPGATCREESRCAPTPTSLGLLTMHPNILTRKAIMGPNTAVGASAKAAMTPPAAAAIMAAAAGEPRHLASVACC
jgi:hypothetical protein